MRNNPFWDLNCAERSSPSGQYQVPGNTADLPKNLEVFLERMLWVGPKVPLTAKLNLCSGPLMSNSFQPQSSKNRIVENLFSSECCCFRQRFPAYLSSKEVYERNRHYCDFSSILGKSRMSSSHQKGCCALQPPSELSTGWMLLELILCLTCADPLMSCL